MENTQSLLNDVVLDGTSQIEAPRRSDIKQVSQKPTIVVCFPIGDKHESTVLRCPADQGGCGSVWMAPGLRQPNLVPVQLMLAHMNMVQPLNVTMTYLVEAGRLSAEARQIMTKQAIRMGAKYVLYWDDDTLPPDLGLYTLFNYMEKNPHVGAITAIYTTRESPQEPLIYKEHGVGAGWDIPIGPGAEPVQIFGAGAGFLLARLEAIVDTIEQMKAANDGVELPIWADERTIPVTPGVDAPRRAMWGHDVRFCKMLNDHGWPVYAHGAVLCGHLDIKSGKTFHMPDDAPGWTIPRSGALSYPLKVAALAEGSALVAATLVDQHYDAPIQYAEVGVYEGATTRLVNQVLPKGSTLHLFDFEDKLAAIDVDTATTENICPLWGCSRKLYDSYNWQLQKALDAGVRLDAALLDGAHSYHHDALAFFLLDKMLKPGGLLMFDDYSWSHATSPSMNPQVFPQIHDQYTDEQIATPQIKLIVDSLVKTNPNYEEVVPDFAYRKKS